MGPFVFGVSVSAACRSDFDPHAVFLSAAGNGAADAGLKDVAEFGIL
jgi:hypothetical protein